MTRKYHYMTRKCHYMTRDYVSYILRYCYISWQISMKFLNWTKKQHHNQHHKNLITNIDQKCLLLVPFNFTRRNSPNIAVFAKKLVTKWRIVLFSPTTSAIIAINSAIPLADARFFQIRIAVVAKSFLTTVGETQLMKMVGQ